MVWGARHAGKDVTRNHAGTDEAANIGPLGSTDSNSVLIVRRAQQNGDDGEQLFIHLLATNWNKSLVSKNLRHFLKKNTL